MRSAEKKKCIVVQMEERRTTMSNGTNPYVFQVHAPASTGNQAAAMIQSDSSEASLRFYNAGDEVPWHVGSGGGAGAGMFFIWGGSFNTGLLFTISPQGAATIANGLTVAGGDILLSAANMSLLNLPQATGVQLNQVMIDLASGQLFYQ
jgi:hypothetical protein